MTNSASYDEGGVRGADALLLLTPNDKSRGCGCWVELGMALALGKLVFITGPQRARTIFCDLASGQYETDEAGVAAIKLRMLIGIA